MRAILLLIIFGSVMVAGCAGDTSTTKTTTTTIQTTTTLSSDEIIAAYSCENDSDCVHTCGMRCVNREWAKNFTDWCMNVRPYDCSCVNGVCYSDGRLSNPVFCELPPETGPCKAYMPRWFFNTTSGACEEFIYGGCQGNANNFDSLSECENICIR